MTCNGRRTAVKERDVGAQARLLSAGDAVGESFQTRRAGRSLRPNPCVKPTRLRCASAVGLRTPLGCESARPRSRGRAARRTGRGRRGQRSDRGRVGVCCAVLATGAVGWQGRCPPQGPPNISSSRPPELAVVNVTGQRPAAAEHHRWARELKSTLPNQ